MKVRTIAEMHYPNKASNTVDELYRQNRIDSLEKLITKQLILSGVVVRSADVNIADSDIAIIEALHDLLLDAHGYSLDFVILKRARELTAKMYKALY